MEHEHIVKLVATLDDGTSIIERSDGTLERRKSETNWNRLDALTDEEIEEAVRSDPDWEGLEDIDWSQIKLKAPVRKQPISIRLDADILEFFRSGGTGYQKRINTVLRSYMEAAPKGGSEKAGAKRPVQKATRSRFG